jgi:L-lactate utilization protein LutC
VNREAFLARLGERLANAAPPATAHPPGPVPATVPRPAFAADERSLEIRFGEALERIRGRLATVEELPGLFEEYEIRTVVVTDERLPLPEGVERLPLDQANVADAGVTAAVAACAVTGTVVLAPSATETRMASLLPRVHVVAVDPATLVETPGDVLRELPRWFPDGLPSAFALASGPSKSADIDAEVTYGVHGPLAVIAVLL